MRKNETPFKPSSTDANAKQKASKVQEETVGLEQLLSTPTEVSEEEFQELCQQVLCDKDGLSLKECQQELIEAARYNDIDVVRAILSCHYTDEALFPKLLHYADSTSGNTALHMAGANGHLDVVKLLLAAGVDPNKSNNNGNTPLHWAATNQQEAVVQLLSAQEKIDVLQRNAFGRSILTEGFASDNANVIQTLLEHESASEERLTATCSQTMAGVKTKDQDSEEESPSVTHILRLGRHLSGWPITLNIRELPLDGGATDDSLIVASRAERAAIEDTTGRGIWAASLVAAQWLVDCIAQSGVKGDAISWPSMNDRPFTVVELGAGCGVPGLAVAQALSDKATPKLYLTDAHPTTIENLQHNATLNNRKGMDGRCDVEVHAMDWNDTSTWPTKYADVVLGCDLIYQSDMVPLLVQTVISLLSDKNKTTTGRFYYVAPSSGRRGHDELIKALSESLILTAQTPAPSLYKVNPLASQDEEECFLHFSELMQETADYQLYIFDSKSSI